MLRPHTIIILLLSPLTLLPALPSYAITERSLTLDPDHRALATQYQGKALYLRAALSTGGPDNVTSATLLNSRYAAASYHQIAFLNDPSATFSVGTGPNYNTNPGTVIPVARVIPHPDASFSDPNKPDLVLLEFAQPLPGAATATIAPTSPGDLLTFVGYGNYGDPQTTLARDGNGRAARAPVLSTPPDGYSPDLYADAGFDANTTFPPLNGRALAFDSGGPWFNTANQLVGISIAVSDPTPDTGSTTFLRLAAPEVLSWIHSVIGLPGDTNDDGVVDLTDLNNVLNNFGDTGTSPGDEDGNGVVDLADLNNVLNNFGNTTSPASALPIIPEPASLSSVLYLASYFVLRRRRR